MKRSATCPNCKNNDLSKMQELSTQAEYPYLITRKEGSVCVLVCEKCGTVFVPIVDGRLGR